MGELGPADRSEQARRRARLTPLPSLPLAAIKHLEVDQLDGAHLGKLHPCCPQFSESTAVGGTWSNASMSMVTDDSVPRRNSPGRESTKRESQADQDNLPNCPEDATFPELAELMVIDVETGRGSPKRPPLSVADRLEQPSPSVTEDNSSAGEGEQRQHPGGVPRQRRVSLDWVDMSPKSQAILCAIPAAAVLQGLGYLFRTAGDASQYCKTVDHIGHFWSYSRHGSMFSKVSTLLLYYNGAPSALAGLVVAAASALILPLDWCSSPHTAGVLTMGMAACATFVALVMWPSRQEVFWDKACIPQESVEQKRIGMLSLGHFLSNSRTLIVLWDATYFERLWCVFEFAVFLKLAKNSDIQHSVQVLPASYGGMAVVLHVGCLLALTVHRLVELLAPGPPPLQEGAESPRAAVQVAVVAALGFTVVLGAFSGVIRRSIELHAYQRERLELFCYKDAKCACCSNQHLHPETLQRLSCDRQLIGASVAEWFGDPAEFEQFVREDVRSQVHTAACPPYSLLMYALMPFAWEALGESLWLWRSARLPEAWPVFFERAGVATLLGPLALACTWRILAFFVACSRSVDRDEAAASSVLSGSASRCALAAGVAVSGSAVLLLLLVWRLFASVLGTCGYAVNAALFGPVVLAAYWRHC